MQPLVSVIIPTFNRAQFIERAIKSVINQTYTNWELLIIDDGSTDNTAALVSPFATADNRISYHLMEENGGVCRARNKGIQLAKGDYITFLDSDDEFLTQKIELQVSCFQETEIPNVGVVSCGREDFRNGKKYFEWVPKYRGNIINNILRKDRIGAQTPLMMIRRSLLIDNNIYFDPQLPSGEEWDLLLRVCQIAAFDFVAKPLLRVHQHSGERVYTNERGLIAFEKQYNKYQDLLRVNKKVHDRFVLKMAVQNWAYGQAGKAINLLNHSIIDKDFKIIAWKTYMKTFPKYSGLPSKVLYKVLEYTSLK